MPNQTGDIAEFKYRLSFRVRKSVAYHDHRRSHYIKLDAGVKILGLIIASAVFTDNFGGEDWAKWLGVVFILASSASLVLRFGFMGYLHDSLYKDFSSLQQKLVEMRPPTARKLESLESEIIAVESREPPIYPALNRYCHNQICRIDDQKKFIKPLRFHHLLLKNVIQFTSLPSGTK